MSASSYIRRRCKLIKTAHFVYTTMKEQIQVLYHCYFTLFINQNGPNISSWSEVLLTHCMRLNHRYNIIIITIDWTGDCVLNNIFPNSLHNSEVSNIWVLTWIYSSSITKYKIDSQQFVRRRGSCAQ